MRRLTLNIQAANRHTTSMLISPSRLFSFFLLHANLPTWRLLSVADAFTSAPILSNWYAIYQRTNIFTINVWSVAMGASSRRAGRVMSTAASTSIGTGGDDEDEEARANERQEYFDEWQGWHTRHMHTLSTRQIYSMLFVYIKCSICMLSLAVCW